MPLLSVRAADGRLRRAVAAHREWKRALHRDKEVFGANEARVTKHLTEVSSLGSFGSQSFGVTFIEPAQFEADVAELERDP